MSDIVERLRSTYLTASFNALNGCQDCGIAANDASQAADEITRLTAEVERRDCALSEAGDRNIAIILRNAALTARVAELEGALRGVVDDEPCSLDHHGYCQTHCLNNPCEMAVARAALSQPAEKGGK